VIAVRTAAPADLPGLLALYAQLNPDDPPLENPGPAYINLLATPGLTVFVLEDAGTIAATCTLVVIPNLTRNARPYALIENVVTSAAHRTRGHGSAVIKTALSAAWAANCYKVMLLTGSKRPETLRFYQNLGFIQNKTGFQIRNES
jgi:GNAT superfamily N-acetyltransferase